MTAASDLNVWKAPQLWWRVAIVLVVALGLMSGERRLAFFTSQSNVIVLGYFAVAVYWMIARRTVAAPAPRLRGGVTLWITVTGLVSHVILNQGESPLPGLSDPDAATALVNQSLFLIHYVVPVMVLIDWVAFGPHRVVRWRDGLLWLLYPIAYGALSLVRAAAFGTVSDRFPYPFLDYEELGGGVVIALLRIVAIIAVLAVLIIGLDRLASFITQRVRGDDVDKSDREDPIADTVVA